MERDLDLEKDEPIVMADECGDSMWNAVLEQEVKDCDVEVVSKNTASLPPGIDAAQVSNTLKN